MPSGGSQPVLQVSPCVSGLFELPPAEEAVERRMWFFEVGLSAGSPKCFP